MKTLPFLLASIAAFLSGCDTPSPKNPSLKTSDLKQSQRHCLVKAPWPEHFSIQRVFDMMEKQNFQEANRYVQRALQISPKNAYLHLMNGFIFEEMVRAGDDSRKELICVAYQSARNLDPSLWISPYFLGLAFLREERFEDAQQNLSDALILCPNNAEVAYGLAYTSYYLHQLDIAVFAILKAVNADPNNPLYARGAAMIFAASGNAAKANYYFSRYQSQVGAQEPDLHVVRRRLIQWNAVHQKNGLQKTASNFGNHIAGANLNQVINEGGKPGGAGAKELPTFKDIEDDDNPAIQIDCMLLRSNVILSSSKGNNILESLNAILTSSASNPLFLKNTVQSWDMSKTPGFSSTQTITKNFPVTLQAATYALNILNAKEETLELHGRSTLMAMVGGKATFNQGDQYVGSGAVVGGGTSATPSLLSVESGTNIDLEVVSLSPDGILTINIFVKSVYFVSDPVTTKSASAQLFHVSRANVNTTVKVRLGETIILGGMFENNRTTQKSGVPFLKDIPLVQYLFSNETTSENSNSVIYILRPEIRGQSPASKKYAMSTRKKLQTQGMLNFGPNDRFIIEAIEKSPMYQNFCSGDLPKPYWGGHGMSMKDRFQQIEAYVIA